MATAGNFPKDIGDTIFLADYNTIQSVIAGVVSTYYGNAISSSQLSGTPTISPAEWDNLRADINKATKHITNADSTVVDVASGGIIYKDDINAYKVAADYCETNKNTVHPAQLASSVASQSLTTAWNGVRTWTRYYTWGSAEAANYFFNAGGYFVCDVSGSNSTGSSKDEDWQNNILNAIPTQTYTRTNWVNNTDILVQEFGNISQYVENVATIQFFKFSSTQLRVIVTLNDADTGDQTGIGPAVDENVNTDAAATITKYRSIDAITGYDAVDETITSW
jgi:hypothetical protein